MKIERVVAEPLTVIGKLGSAADGEGFIERLWDDFKAHFGEIKSSAKLDENGGIIGFWGLTKGYPKTYMPWEAGLADGVYLAGVEAVDEYAVAPDGWTKWIEFSWEYLYTQADDELPEVWRYLNENGIDPTDGVWEFFSPEELWHRNGEKLLFFPIREAGEPN